jgi:hypothetical protein
MRAVRTRMVTAQHEHGADRLSEVSQSVVEPTAKEHDDLRRFQREDRGYTEGFGSPVDMDGDSDNRWLASAIP